MVQKAALVLVGDYVEAYEVMVPFQALQAYGLRVDAICPGKKAGDSCKTAVHDFLGYQTYSELPGNNFLLNATFEEVDVASYDILIIPGGRAPEYLCIKDSVLKLVKTFAALDRPIASICHGQLILAAAGLLKGKKCTAYPAVKPVVDAAGGKWLDPSPISACFVDGQLITGAAWPGHPEFLALSLQSLGATVSNAHKRVLFLCGDFMEDYEVMVPFQALQGLGYSVDAVCPDKKANDKCITAIHDEEGAQTCSEWTGHNFLLNADFNAVKVHDYDALVIPGGRSPEYLAVNEKVLEITREFAKADKPIAAICHGQQVLAAAGVLKGKKCTACPAIKYHMMDSGAEWVEPDPPQRKSFTDGKLVTAPVWFANAEFISQLISLLGTEVTFSE